MYYYEITLKNTISLCSVLLWNYRKKYYFTMMMKQILKKVSDWKVFFSVELRYSVRHNPKAMAKLQVISLCLCYIFILMEGESKNGWKIKEKLFST